MRDFDFVVNPILPDNIVYYGFEHCWQLIEISHNIWLNLFLNRKQTITHSFFLY